MGDSATLDLNKIQCAGDIHALAWSPEGKRLAVFVDGKLAIHSAMDGTVIAERPVKLDPSEDPFYRFLWTRDGRRIVLGDFSAGKVRLHVFSSDLREEKIAENSALTTSSQFFDLIGAGAFILVKAPSGKAVWTYNPSFVLLLSWESLRNLYKTDILTKPGHSIHVPRFSSFQRGCFDRIV